jgi:hypothetical protein
MKPTLTVVILLCLLLLYSGCASTKRNCTPTTDEVKNDFPGKMWTVDQIGDLRRCKGKTPLLYFGKDGKCGYTSRGFERTGEYRINACDNLIEMYLPGDTFLFMVHSFNKQHLALIEFAEEPRGKLSGHVWHFQLYKNTHKPAK